MTSKTSLIVLGILLAIPGRAQQTAPSSWDELKRLHPGQKIEVIDQNLRVFKGSYRDVSEDEISLTGPNGNVVLQRHDVLRVGVHGGRRRNNALQGAIIGVLAGLAVGAWVDYHDDVDRSDPGSNNGKIAASLFGAGVGGAFGTAFPGYRTIYRANPSRSTPSLDSRPMENTAPNSSHRPLPSDLIK
jgi:hypothetical protein